MDFWLISALLTFAATLAVLLPLMRRNRILSPSMHNDLAVYRDQLREVEADAARGMIDAESAEQARIEISRRILNAEKAAIEAQENAARKGSSRLVAFVAVLSVPLIAWGLYPLYGRPDMPSQPLQARLAESPDRNSVAELIARAERHLAQNPDDARGWDVLAPIYLRLGRNGDAVNAYRTAIRLAGENAQRLLGLGEALTVVAGGTVTAEAEAAFEKAAQLAPDDLVASYYLAQRDLQDGKPEAAIARLQGLLDKMPADARQRVQLQQAIERVKQMSGSVPAAPSAMPGPTAEDVEAVSSMSAEDRQAMVEGMVRRLDAKLRENGNDIEGWKRLIRSYMMLNKPSEAEDALARGIAALSDHDRVALKDFAAGFGLTSGSEAR